MDVDSSNCRSIYLTQTASQSLYSEGTSGGTTRDEIKMRMLLAIGFLLFYISLFHQPGVDHFLLESPLIAYFERRYFLLGD
jgi:hypothetical protein